MGLFVSMSFSEQKTLKIGEEAPSIYLFKLESNKYFKSKELPMKAILANLYQVPNSPIVATIRISVSLSGKSF